MSKQTRFDKVKLLGVEVDAFTNRDAVNYICDLAEKRKRSGYVIKPYVEFLDRADRDNDIRDLLNGAELSLADGVALTWAANYLFAGPHTAVRFWSTLLQIVLAPDKLRWPLPDRTSGINFTWPLLHEAARRQLRLYIIGKSSAQEIEAVAGIISKHEPGAVIAGTRAGFDPEGRPGRVTESWLADTVAAVKAADADLVLIGMGFPLQENVCAYLSRQLPRGVFIGEGGTFDYDSFGGARRKAPAWMQREGIEWIWRLILEPSRIRRQLAIPRFIARIWQSRRR